jgi:predicted ATP-binding protein involved in virulence
MTYLKAIYVYNCYTSQNFQIDFSPKADEPFRHLIVTGKNGSGKTTLLNAVDNALMEKSGLDERDPKVDVTLTDDQSWCLKKILTGIPYHVLMKSHFGIESEYSRLATEKLKNAKTLIQKGDKRTEADDEELRRLAQELDELSPDLSLDIFLELERQKQQ